MAPVQAESLTGNYVQRQPAASRTTISSVSKAVAMYGTPRSRLPWHSGFWTGTMSRTESSSVATWRGSSLDFVTVYPQYGTWRDLANSSWMINTYQGYPARLSYGLPLLPNDRKGQWGDVTSGASDAVFASIAKQLVVAGHGNAAIRVGVEANGDWTPWGVTAATAPQYKAAFQRVVRVMRAQAPRLTFWFDLSAGYQLRGQKNRLDALTLMYPGDAYVHGISIDHYDAYYIRATTATQWAAVLRPQYGPGLADAAQFARAHRKGLAVPEWGLHGTAGGRDNPFFIRSMYQWFQANKDLLVFECYFSEPASYIRNSLWNPVQMPKSSAAYRSLF